MKILISILLILFCVTSVSAQDDFWTGTEWLDTAADHWYDHEGTGLPATCGHEYWTYNPMLFEWDPLADADHYEIKLLWLDPDPDREILVGFTTFTSIVINRPRSGHFVFGVRGCNNQGCGPWSSSDNENVASVDSEPRKWRVYWSVPPPSDIIIE